MTDAEMIRLAINKVKEFALSNEYENALDLAQKEFVANPSTHNDWNALGEGMKELFVKLAEGAIHEITTGKEIK